MELLVVITIIVILLALLTPAVDRAVYQAELAVCGSRLKLAAHSAVLYTFDFARRYPYRQLIERHAGTPMDLAGTEDFLTPSRNYLDDRPTLLGYMPVEAFLDPLAAKIDLEPSATPPGTTTYVVATTALWFGVKYPQHEGMKKLGDRFQWTQNNVRRSFSALASDQDFHSTVEGRSFASHHDDQRVMRSRVERGGTLGWYFSRWEITGGVARGLVDMNYAYDDGSVERMDNVAEVDHRLVRVPLRMNLPDSTHWLLQLPGR